MVQGFSYFVLSLNLYLVSNSNLLKINVIFELGVINLDNFSTVEALGLLVRTLTDRGMGPLTDFGSDHELVLENVGLYITCAGVQHFLRFVLEFGHF